MLSLTHAILLARARLASTRARTTVHNAVVQYKRLVGIDMPSMLEGALSCAHYLRRSAEWHANRRATGRIDAAVGRLHAMLVYQHTRPCSELWIRHATCT